MGSDDKLGEVKNATEQFQSTLPRGERLYLTGAIEDAAKISIHAPAWGATLADGRRKRKVRISIHAPAWGATLRLQARQRRSGHFNPRSRVGSDGWCAGKQHNLTHHFNPRSRVGSDLRRYPMSKIPYNFNPRSRVGSDDEYEPIARKIGISIHAPAWGATWGDRMTKVELNISIHAPAWGATRDS